MELLSFSQLGTLRHCGRRLDTVYMLYKSLQLEAARSAVSRAAVLYRWDPLPEKSGAIMATQTVMPNYTARSAGQPVAVPTGTTSQ